MEGPASAAVRSRQTSWIFEPRTEPPSQRDAATRFHAQLESALRAGHGVGASFAIGVDSGTAGPLVLSAPDSVSERWVDRVLSSAYEPGQWRRARVPWPSGEPSYIGRRLAFPGETGSPPPEPGAVLRTLGQAFATLPKGFRVEAAFAPVRGLRTLERWLGWVGPSPAAGSSRAPGRPFDHSRPQPIASRIPPPPLWRAEVVLTLDRRAAACVQRATATAVEGAWRRVDGKGLRFRRRLRTWGRPSAILIAEPEMLGLLPGREGIGARESGSLPSSPALPLGRTIDGQVVGSPFEPSQGRHLAIVGETGMGKSSLLIALACRAARLGGVVVLDPLGETARTLRTELAPYSDRVLWVAPGEGSPSINALEGVEGERANDPVRAERRIDDMVHGLRRVRSGRYADSSFWGPRLEEMLSRAVRAASAIPGGTLADAHTLLATSGRTRSVAPPSAQEALRELAERIRERPDDAEGARRLLYELARNPTLAQMLCARSPTLSASELVSPGRIVLVSGDAPRVGESTARYLFAVYLALLWSELLARDAPSKTFVVLDEAQWFAHESLAEMLRLARRLNVHVILATQSLGSLPEAVRDAVWTNVADFVAFRGSPDEARELARTASGVSAEAILALPRGEATVFLGKGESVRRIRTSRLPRGTDVSFRASAPEAFAPAAGADRAGDREGEPLRSSRFLEPDPASLGRRHDADSVLERLRALSAVAGSTSPMAVVLEELRAGPDPVSDRAIRSAGSLLGRLGALERVERSSRGTVWWVDRARIPALEPTNPEVAAGAVSRAPQPS